jgi:hypothetical protein
VSVALNHHDLAHFEYDDDDDFPRKWAFKFADVFVRFLDNFLDNANTGCFTAVSTTSVSSASLSRTSGPVQTRNKSPESGMSHIPACEVGIEN